LQYLLGHKSIAMVMRYAHLIPGDDGGVLAALNSATGVSIGGIHARPEGEDKEKDKLATPARATG
ncbi:MAG: hypothetical protein ACYTHN_16275, partial [Planctomycetota bacterium]